LSSIIDEAGVREGCDRKYGNLLYTTASKFPPNALVHRPVLLRSIMNDELKSISQLDGCFEYLKGVGEEPLDSESFRRSGGIGVTVLEEDIDAALQKVIDGEGERLITERYTCVNPLLPKLKAIGNMRWADQKLLKAKFDAKILEILGPKTEADMAKGAQKKKEKKSKQKAAAAAEAEKLKTSAADEPPADPYAFLPKPSENNVVHTTVNFSDGHIMRIANTKEELEKHLAETGGKVMTRFPPEPNGYLHIGHAKAMFVDFGMAKRYDGLCCLRFDDTNPAAEKTEYIDHIKEIVAWMGWEPYRITYSSDYFDELHALAVKLIESGHAYVDHQTGDEIAEYRALKKDSPWRDRPIAESLKLFEDMRLGLVDEGKATLRMKMDMRNDNFNMYDLIAYRIKFSRHPHAGDKWCIYPSYDFTHCIVDSLEKISHSLCTLEFEPRRASYYWLLEVLGLYKPLVWEYSRLNVTNSVMSKRKLNALVTDGHVNGWDDPRLLTLAGLRRRGATPESINNFCKDVGITRNANDIPVHKLEHHIRGHLDEVAERRMGVLRPLKVTITNHPEGEVEVVKAKVFPGRSDSTYDAPLTRVIYVEHSDFREKDSKNYFGLAPGKTVMLRYGFAIKCLGFRKEGDDVVELTCERVEVAKPPKGVIHWVAAGHGAHAPVEAEVRLYGNLFKSENVAEVEDWLADIDPESLEVVHGALLTPEFRKAKVGDKFQMERVGYFCLDRDSTDAKFVLNRTCSLKESVSTKDVKKTK